LHSRQQPKLRVFVVEDENLVALILEEMLIDLGHDVVGPVSRLSSALEMAQREDIDVAILDINIGGRESYPIADVLIARAIPVIFATGYHREKLPEVYRGRPMLNKPYQQDDVQDIFATIFRSDLS
jgi:CheY-like chemotaxis protein